MCRQIPRLLQTPLSLGRYSTSHESHQGKAGDWVDGGHCTTLSFHTACSQVATGASSFCPHQMPGEAPAVVCTAHQHVHCKHLTYWPILLAEPLWAPIMLAGALWAPIMLAEVLWAPNIPTHWLILLAGRLSTYNSNTLASVD